MTNSVKFGSGHCCVCTGVCGHIGGPHYCAEHRPIYTGAIPEFNVPASRKDYDAMRARAEAAEARVAELEAELSECEAQLTVATRLYDKPEYVEAFARMDAHEKCDQERMALEAEVAALRATVERVTALTYADTGGREYEHVKDCRGESTCGACWAADLRAALGGEQ